MNKKKKKKIDMITYKAEALKIIKEDSIAHLVKDYFTIGNIHNNELFQYNKEDKNLLVSEKALNHLLRICDSEMLEQDFNFKLVPEIKLILEEKER